MRAAGPPGTNGPTAPMNHPAPGDRTQGNTRRRRVRVRLASFLTALLLACAGAAYAALLVLMVVDPAQALAILTGILIVGGPGLGLLLVLFVLADMVAGPKRVVLFLRRFGLARSTETLTRLLRASLANSWRSITLDDLSFPRLGLERAAQVAWYGLALLLLAAAIATPVFILMVLPVYPSANVSGVMGLLLLFSLSIVSELILLNLTILLAIPLCLAVHAVRTWWRARLVVSSTADLTATLAWMARLGSWFRASRLMAPRSTIVQVDTALWKQAVAAYAQQASAVVIDISEATENVLWEAQHCLERHEEKTLLVGPRDATPAPALQALIGGRTVLRYAGPGDRAFRLALRQALDGIAEPQGAALPAAPAPGRAWRALAAPVLYIALFPLSGIIVLNALRLLQTLAGGDG